MERIIRSPFLSILLYVILGGLMTIILYRDQIPSAILDRMYWISTGAAGLILLLFIIGMIFIAKRNRKKHFSLLLPWELREEDEGQLWVTFKACRNVYIYFYVAIPFAMLIVLFFHGVKWIPICIFTLLGIGQNIVYWWQIRKLNIDED